MAKHFEVLILGIRGISLKMRQLREKLKANSEISRFNDRQIFILERMQEHKKISPREIIGYFPGIAPSTITADLKLFQENGIVEKNFSTEDQRVHLVTLTRKGEEFAEEINKYQIETYKPLHRALKKSEAQFEVLIDVVKAANDELNKELENFKIDND